MARNKYPEETVRRILDVAEELFMTKGYEHTTMADIVDGLGGLTKGAVYHHFKSKEDIFEAVFERANRPVLERSDAIMADRSLTGLEKLRALDRASSEGPSADMWHAMRPSSDPIQNARILAREYADLFETAHQYVEPAIREGVADGSIAALHPRETAEVLLLLANLWMVPLFNPVPADDPAAYQRRAETFLLVAHALGVDLVEWESLDPARAGKVAQEQNWMSWQWMEKGPAASAAEEPGVAAASAVVASVAAELGTAGPKVDVPGEPEPGTAEPCSEKSSASGLGAAGPGAPDSGEAGFDAPGFNATTPNISMPTVGCPAKKQPQGGGGNQA